MFCTSRTGKTLLLKVGRLPVTQVVEISSFWRLTKLDGVFVFAMGPVRGFFERDRDKRDGIRVIS